MGLVPIGMNPVTKLWEFYDLRSAWDGKQAATEIVIPTHKEDGSIEVKAGTGIVFVLLPGGTVTLGSQKDDPNAPFYDPQRQDDETLHEVTLSPFLLARHELTQGQWARLWTWDAELRDPSNYKAGTGTSPASRITLANPVEQVDWPMCDRLLTRHGLVLPTEAQWEYGCRGGTTTVWNVDFEQLKKIANLADADSQVIRSRSGVQLRVVARRPRRARAGRHLCGERLRALRRARQRQRVVPRLVWGLRQRACRRWPTICSSPPAGATVASAAAATTTRLSTRGRPTAVSTLLRSAAILWAYAPPGSSDPESQ
jgi:hypothetical protein